MPKVLVVDDEDQNLDFFEQVLTREKYTVAKAHDGIEALDRFEKFEPDIVLCDLMMPRLNGYEVCSRLKHRPSSRRVPIILLSALTDDEVNPMALQSGANLFLNKPVDPDTLLANISALLKLAKISTTR